MLISKILYLVGKYISDRELVETIESNTTTSDDITIYAPYIDLLNMVRKRLATEYFSLKTKENIDTASQDVFLFKNLTKPFHKLIKVTNNEKSVRFDILNNGILLPKGVYEIWYQYLPDVINYSDTQIDDFNGKVNERIYALGIASEYCLLNGMYDTSNYFEEKFINAINSIKTSSGFKNLPKRRWL